jgi:regulator of sirC expression with transglutaminase-like and TPR domain
VDVYSALCWAYALDQEPQPALSYCNQAVELGSPVALDSRGIVQAQLGRYEEAVADFKAFLAWLEQQPAHSPYRAHRPVVEEWIRALEQEHNPIDPATLAHLRLQ